MRILIDTNIFIHFEDNKVMDESYSKFLRLCSLYKHQIVVHPYSIEDILQDKDPVRKSISLSKVKRYQALEYPPIPTQTELNDLGLNSSTRNDEVDNIILFALVKETVGILITEDVGIHKKAKYLGLDTRVLFLKQALHALELLHTIEDHRYPNIINNKVYNLNINEPFFDSLKLDYPEFSIWFKRISQEARDCWIYNGHDNSLGGLIIYKDEMNPVITHNGEILEGKTLKISTLKVSEQEQGKKIGELFLKKIFSFALKNDYKNIYLTTKKNKQEYLINLIEDFGFKEFELCTKQRDIVYVKEIPSSAPYNRQLDSFEYHKKFFPYFDAHRTKKHFIPIQPSFHRILFPEIEKQQQFFYNNLQAGNTIKKIYLSHSKYTKMSSGDIVLFYRSEDRKAITTLGIVEHIKNAKANDFNKVLEYSIKRSVYNYEQIKEYSKKDTLIVLFRIISHFNTPLTREWLLSNTQYKNWQAITEIDDTSFRKILKHDNYQYFNYRDEY
ncbi:GNAT family N-acetyltransferase [Sulfurimonas sp.]|uniref:GNAT family N-acetyltransferase n=1 Tax=Sulfurimonas sp. TaxID=2022749 RepID=UPI003567E6F3